MRAHGLNQKGLAEVFGTASIVSEVLSGKRFPVNPRRIASDKVEFSVCSSVPRHTAMSGCVTWAQMSELKLRPPGTSSREIAGRCGNLPSTYCSGFRVNRASRASEGGRYTETILVHACAVLFLGTQPSMKASAVSRDTFCFCEPRAGSRAARRIWPDRSSQTLDASPGSLELSANEAPRLLQELPLAGIVQARRPRLLSSRILRCLNSTSHLFSPTATMIHCELPPQLRGRQGAQSRVR